MTDLTEKWKNDKLPSSWDNSHYDCYYIKLKTGKIQADSYFGFVWGNVDRRCISEILVKVPTYDEYEELKEKLKIAIETLETYSDRNNWSKEGNSFMKYNKGWTKATQALAKIKE